MVPQEIIPQQATPEEGIPQMGILGEVVPEEAIPDGGVHLDYPALSVVVWQQYPVLLQDVIILNKALSLF